jgi:hypothetical protein
MTSACSEGDVTFKHASNRPPHFPRHQTHPFGPCPACERPKERTHPIPGLALVSISKSEPPPPIGAPTLALAAAQISAQ